MKIESKANCPLDNFNPCRQTDCAWFTQLRGNNPNTGEPIDEWGCAIAWIPVLLIENSQHNGKQARRWSHSATRWLKVTEQTTLLLKGQL